MTPGPRAPGRSLLALLLLALAPLWLSGCWDNVDVRDRAFVLGLGVDLTPEGRVEVTAQMPRPEPGSVSVGTHGSVLALSAAGTDPISALHNLQGRVSRTFLLGHIKAVVLGEPAAREPVVVEHVVDQVLRHPQVDPGAFVMVANGCRASDVMNRGSAEGTASALFAGSALEKGLLGLNVPQSEVWQFLRALQTPGWEPVAIGIRCRPDSLEIADAAVFKRYRMVGWLGPRETRGMLWLMGEGEGSVVEVPSPHGLGLVLINQVTARFRLEPGDPPAARAQVSVSGQLLHKPERLVTITHRDLVALNSLLARRIQLEARLALEKLQGVFGADSIGLGRRFYFTSPYFWRGVNWEREYPRLRVEIVVSAEAGRKGSLR
ncbi:MAG: Ger(x)C family spore germination protein [Acetobacteraceae bacterium]|nr:Ger(x)C family spore germination protein [Acetobacteraceae bacterium]